MDNQTNSNKITDQKCNMTMEDLIKYLHFYMLIMAVACVSWNMTVCLTQWATSSEDETPSIKQKSFFKNLGYMIQILKNFPKVLSVGR